MDMQPELLDLAWQIWEMRVGGASAYEIARTLGTTTQRVRKIISECESELLEDLSKNVETVRAMALRRYEAVLQQYMPVMRAGRVQVERTNAEGESLSDDDWKYCIQAGHIVLKAIDGIAKLQGLTENESVNQGSAKLSDALATFLRDVNPSITKIVEAQPIEIRSLPSTDGGRNSGA